MKTVAKITIVMVVLGSVAMVVGGKSSPFRYGGGTTGGTTTEG